MKRFAIILMVIGMSALFSVAALAIPKEGLVLHFDFDGGSVDGDTIKDLSENGNDAIMNGGVTAIADGLEFDGADGYVGGEPLAVRTGGEIPFTALAWFKTTEVPNGPLWMWGDNALPSASSGAEGPVGWRTGTGNFAAGFYQGGHFYADAEESYADGEWHHVAQVGAVNEDDEHIGLLYIDGQQISSTTAGYQYAGPPYFILGARSKNSGSEIDDTEYFDGVIGEVAIYSVTLDEADIKAIFDAGLAVSPLGSLSTTWGQMKR